MTTGSQIDDTKESVYSFLDKIATAKREGLEWVETTPDMIRHYNRNGLNGAKYFVFEGIKVCEHGMSEKLEEDHSEDMAVKLHGKNEGKLVGVGA